MYEHYTLLLVLSLLYYRPFVYETHKNQTSAKNGDPVMEKLISATRDCTKQLNTAEH